jgi:uncharacterized protein (TIGR00369 family)
VVPKDPNYRARVESIFRAAPFIESLGIELRDFGPGFCETTLRVERRHLQQDQFIHAAVQATMADHTSGAAVGTLLRADQIVLTVEYKVNLLRPATGEHLRCRADVLRAGTNLSVAEASVFARSSSRGEKLVSKAIVTLVMVSRPAT